VLPWRTAGLSGGTSKCPVPHAGQSGAPRNCSPTTSSRWHCGEKTTTLSSVKSGLSGVKSLRANGHLRCQIQRLGAPGKGHQTVRCTTGLSGLPQRATTFLHRLVLCWVYKYHPNQTFQGVGAQATYQTYSRHSQVLIHPSA
jgi:hypothetical protein